MRAENIIDAVGQVDDSFILEAMVGKKSGGKFNAGKAVKTLLIAAVIASLMTVTAYASDFLGFRSMIRPEKTEILGETYDMISITQPQTVPEELEDEKTRKIKNSKAAWEEWRTYITEKHDSEKPTIIKYQESLDGGDFSGYTELEDGTYEWKFYNIIGVYDETGEATGEQYEELLATKIFSAGEQAEYEAWLEKINALYSDNSPYDFNYCVYSEDEARALEDLAAKYGLKLRGNRKSALSSESSSLSGEGFYTNAELAAMTAEWGNSGSVFYETPIGFDKVYWFDEGSFCVSFYINVPSTGEKVTCYGYNSMYSTLSSGNEVGIIAKDTESYTSRTHTAPDGTELTVMSDGEEAYFYVFLDNSYFAAHISGARSPMTDADVDAIIDSLNYSVISHPSP